jgi:ribonuclease G
LVVKQLEKRFFLAVHPFIHAFLTKGLFSKQLGWFMRFHRWIPIIEKSNFSVVEFKFYNKNKDEIIFGLGE